MLTSTIFHARSLNFPFPDRVIFHTRSRDFPFPNNVGQWYSTDSWERQQVFYEDLLPPGTIVLLLLLVWIHSFADGIGLILLSLSDIGTINLCVKGVAELDVIVDAVNCWHDTGSSKALTQ